MTVPPGNKTLLPKLILSAHLCFDVDSGLWKDGGVCSVLWAASKVQRKLVSWATCCVFYLLSQKVPLTLN